MANQPTPDPAHFKHDIERLDQHFLNARTAARIVQAARTQPDDVVLEIGAGTGILTSAIIAATPARVIAVESDERCRPYLERLRSDDHNLVPLYDRIEFLYDRIQSIRRVDLAACTIIIANPPFSALDHLTRLLRELPNLRRAVLCVGRRWADAVTAEPGTPAYGLTSLAIQSRFTSTITDTLDGTVFTPAIGRPAALLEVTRRVTPDRGFDLLADALLNHAGLRLKDVVRSRRVRQTLGPYGHQSLLHAAAVRRFQQRRLQELTHDQLSLIAQAWREST